MKFTTGDAVVAASAAVATVMPCTLLAWSTAGAGLYAADQIDPEPRKLFSLRVFPKERGLAATVGSNVVEYAVHASGWMVLRPLLRKAPTPVAMALGGAAYVGMRHLAGALDQKILEMATQADEGAQKAASARHA